MDLSAMLQLCRVTRVVGHRIAALPWVYAGIRVSHACGNARTDFSIIQHATPACQPLHFCALFTCAHT